MFYFNSVDDTCNFYSSCIKKNRGVYFQINLGSLVGKYGAGARYTAEKMIDENMVEFVSSDLHTVPQFQMLRDCLKSKHLEKILSSDILRNKTLV